MKIGRPKGSRDKKPRAKRQSPVSEHDAAVPADSNSYSNQVRNTLNPTSPPPLSISQYPCKSTSQERFPKPNESDKSIVLEGPSVETFRPEDFQALFAPFPSDLNSGLSFDRLSSSALCCLPDPFHLDWPHW